MKIMHTQMQSTGTAVLMRFPQGSLTTVISSALDYKRFLDRRKQMIQQQVESASLGQLMEGRCDGTRSPKRFQHSISP